MKYNLFLLLTKGMNIRTLVGLDDLTLPANSLHLQGQKQHAPACMVALWQAPAFRVRGRRGERPVVCAPRPLARLIASIAAHHRRLQNRATEGLKTLAQGIDLPFFCNDRGE